MIQHTIFPCPFCGNNPQINARELAVFCECDGMTMIKVGGTSIVRAIRRWNTRVVATPRTDKIMKILELSCELMNVDIDVLRSRKSKADVFFRTKMLYTVCCLELRLGTYSMIGSCIGRDHSSINHYREVWMRKYARGNNRKQCELRGIKIQILKNFKLYLKELKNGNKNITETKVDESKND